MVWKAGGGGGGEREGGRGGGYMIRCILTPGRGGPECGKKNLVIGTGAGPHVQNLHFAREG